MEFEDYASRWSSQSSTLEPEHPLLAPTRRSVDQQANRGAHPILELPLIEAA